jgi:hypothetical protein
MKRQVAPCRPLTTALPRLVCYCERQYTIMMNDKHITANKANGTKFEFELLVSDGVNLTRWPALYVTLSRFDSNIINSICNGHQICWLPQVFYVVL